MSQRSSKPASYNPAFTYNTELLPSARDNEDRAEDGEYEGSETNRLAEVATYSFENIMVLIVGIILLIAGVILFVASTFVPVAAVGTGLIISLDIHNAWQTAIHNIQTYDRPSDIDRFVDNASRFEGIWNLILLAIEILITLYNYSLGVLYILYNFFVNYLVAIFKFILDPDTIKFLNELFKGGIQFITTAINTVSSINLFGAIANTVNITGEPGADPGEYFGADGYYPNGSPAITTAFSTRLFYFYSTFMNILEGLPDATYGEFINYIADPVLKNLPYIFEIIGNIAALVSPGGFWSNFLVGDMANLRLRSLMDASSCFGSLLASQISCMLEMSLSGAINRVAIAAGLGSVYISGCSQFTLPTQCSATGLGLPEYAISPFLQEEYQIAAQFSAVFDAGQCDDVDCNFYVVDIYSSLSNLTGFNYSCAFWLYDPAIVYDCMLYVTAYTNVNNTSPSKANPATLAQEICTVALFQNVNSCLNNGGTATFQFDFNQAANSICNPSSPTGGVDYANCTCDYIAPLCTSSCCNTYANHVNLQTLNQIGSRTCAEVGTYFAQNKAWCPLSNSLEVSSPFPDNTYTHMWCSYYNNVIGNLCTFAAPFTRVRDLAINMVLGTYVAQSCSLVINQTGVCVPVNATVDQLGIDIVLGPQTNTSIDLFVANDQASFVPHTPIITNFYVGDSASVIMTKTLNKQFCEQYSLEYKNDNLIYQSQPWTGYAVVNQFCDEQILEADLDLEISQEVFYKYIDVNGNPIPVNLAGLPQGWLAFPTGVNPNLQALICTAPVGPNPNEAALFEACLERLRLQSYDLTTLQIETGNQILSVWSNQSNHTATFIEYNGGIFYLNPPLNLNYTITPYYDLRQTEPAWRFNVTTPPPANSIDQNNPTIPFGQIAGVVPNQATRVLLTLDQYKIKNEKPPPPDYYSDLGKLMRAIFPSYFRAKTKKEIATEYKTKERLKRVGNMLHEHLYLSKRREYEKAGINPDKDVEHFNETKAYLRKLLSITLTTSQNEDQQAINSIWSFFATVPNTPAGGLNKQQYNQFLMDDVLNQMQYVFDLTFTVILPGIFNSMFNFANMQLPPDYYGDFGSIENGTETATNFGKSYSCKATMSDPYKCCGHASSSYECCYGLIGCVPDVAPWLYQRYTTSENLLQRWTCTTTTSFFDWWVFFIKAIITAFVEMTRFFIGYVGLGTAFENLIPKTTIYTLPMNFFFCMLVNSHQLFIGVFYLFAIYVFIGSQVITWFLVLLSGFMARIKAENDLLYTKYEQRKKEITNSTEYGRLKNMTEIRAYQ
jgi:hypothetical protein